MGIIICIIGFLLDGAQIIKETISSTRKQNTVGTTFLPPSPPPPPHPNSRMTSNMKICHINAAIICFRHFPFQNIGEEKDLHIAELIWFFIAIYLSSFSELFESRVLEHKQSKPSRLKWKRQVMKR